VTDWSGRVAIVSGGSKGIGLAISHALAARGARVAICSRSRDNTERAASEVSAQSGTDVIALAADFRRREPIEEAVAETVRRFGGVDILVNNAGVTPFGWFEETTDEDWQETFDLKLFGAVRACRAVLPHMRQAGRGSIVNVIGTSAVHAVPAMSSNGAACAALLMFTKGLSLEVGAHGIRVNAVSPGGTDTERWQQALAVLAEIGGTDAAGAQRQIDAAIPLGRLGYPAEIAEAVVFAASDEASFMTGAHIVVDGGFTPGV
jgi:NAD(P)-dependent dehydrogenase (short-subunit alcohol dehydrogenase family)